MNLVGIFFLLLVTVLGGVMLCIRRQARMLGVVLLSCAVSVILYFLWRDGLWSRGFEKLELGMSIETTLSLMGSPSYETDGTRWVEPEYVRASSDLVPGCVRELWYVSFLHPQRIALCFSSKGVLLRKYPYTSW